ncbi:MAG: hypothetical protein LBH25_03305 [Fibromonadaceae bacterium]|jgi:uncharacterized protein (TIGR02145 family)|nr:hypothetical protein [Fibromonadaceae bacterium]
MIFRLFCFAFLLLLSCADFERDNPFDPGSSLYAHAGVSSSSLQSSSSAVLNNSSSSSQTQFDNVTYEGETYQTVVIGSQTWFARNLNYIPSTGNSSCYNNQPTNCDIYGRLYDWATAMNVSSNCNNFSSCTVYSKHRGICPSGWHIPSNAEWETLLRYVDGGSGTSSNGYYNSPTAGKDLKTTSGWNDYQGSSGNGTNKYGFSALPGGYLSSDNIFSGAGNIGRWWSATQNDYIAVSRSVSYDKENANWGYFYKNAPCYVRCIKD